MSKIIVRRQEYANNGTHANEIEAVVKQNLIVNTLSSAMDVAPSVGLLKNTISGLINAYEVVGTTDTSGNISTSLLTSNKYAIGAFTDRSVNPDCYGADISTINSGNAYMLHFKKADGSILANQSVRAVLFYIDK